MAGSTAASLERLAQDLADARPEIVGRALERLGSRLGRLEGGDYRKAVELACSLFYVDTGDRPDLEPALEKATKLLAREGSKVVPLLLRQMEGSDIKSHTHLARTLGRMGPEAVPPLRHLLATAEDPYSRAFALYALGKMTCPEVVRALPEVLGGMMHPDKEVRDSAARALGKLATAIPSRKLTPRRRREMFETLMRALGDHQPAVRAKAMRSLGKMAVAGLMNRGQLAMFRSAALNALGESAEYSWDNAYIVRREAREALDRLQ